MAFELETGMRLFLKEKSFEEFEYEDILGCLLRTSGVRTDAGQAISNLFDTFGSFKAILEARPEQLLSVDGVTKKIAALISMIVPLAQAWERANLEQPEKLSNRHLAQQFCKSLLTGERNEQFLVIALSSQCRVNGYRKIADGTLSTVDVCPRKVVETALNYNAHSVILAHNHPGGSKNPSIEDLNSTRLLQKILGSVGIILLDHIIVSGTQTYSMVEHGDLEFNALKKIV